jgi:signal transduction histidine kinase
LEVCDHGIGIPEHQREAVFKAFERPLAARHYGGLGLGLFIVRTIVEALGGTVAVRSSSHTGTRFTVSLPQERRSHDKQLSQDSGHR